MMQGILDVQYGKYRASCMTGESFILQDAEAGFSGEHE
jgi:hypothetical protein